MILSPDGDVQFPKEFLDADGINESDRFRFHRIARGQYLLEKVENEKRPRAELVREENGLLVFKAPPGSPTITSDLVKKIEAETL